MARIYYLCIMTLLSVKDIASSSGALLLNHVERTTDALVSQELQIKLVLDRKELKKELLDIIEKKAGDVDTWAQKMLPLDTNNKIHAQREIYLELSPPNSTTKTPRFFKGSISPISNDELQLNVEISPTYSDKKQQILNAYTKWADKVTSLLKYKTLAITPDPTQHVAKAKQNQGDTQNIIRDLEANRTEVADAIMAILAPLNPSGMSPLAAEYDKIKLDQNTNYGGLLIQDKIRLNIHPSQSPASGEDSLVIYLHTGKEDSLTPPPVLEVVLEKLPSMYAAKRLEILSELARWWVGTRSLLPTYKSKRFRALDDSYRDLMPQQ